MDIVIRTMRPEDARALSVIEQQCFSIPWSLSEFEKVLDYEYNHYLVAEKDGRVVGCIGMSDICNEGNIDKVMVEADFRGQGIAGRLMECLLEEGKKLAVEAYTLEVRVSNAPAIHLYERFGFVSEGIRPKFYEKPVEDAMIMWKR